MDYGAQAAHKNKQWLPLFTAYREFIFYMIQFVQCN